MADNAPTEEVATLPTREAGITIRRGIGFLVDKGLISALVGCVWNFAPPAWPDAVLAFLGTAIGFGWWSSSAWLAGGRTPGMLAAGIELRAASGAAPPRSAHFKRAAFLTLFSTAIVIELLNALAGGELPQGLDFLRQGLAIGYLGYAAIESRLRGNVWLFHDRWSGAGISRVGSAVSPPILPGPSSTRLALILVVLTTVPALILGSCRLNGFEPKRLLALSDDVVLSRTFQRRLATMRLRADVGLSESVVWEAGSEHVKLLELNVRVPWAALSAEEGTKLATNLVGQFTAEIDRTHFDTSSFDGVRVKVRSSNGVFGWEVSQKVVIERRGRSFHPTSRDST